jgi:hypothetical protein
MIMENCNPVKWFILQLAFRSVQRSLADTRNRIRQLLCMPQPDSKTRFSNEPIVRELEDTIGVYLRKSVERYDIEKNMEVSISLDIIMNS